MEPYGRSKCLLNDRYRVEEPAWRAEIGVAAVAIHPGWVETDMGGSSAPVNIKDSVDGMFEVFSALSAQSSGQFLTYEGKVHPW